MSAILRANHFIRAATHAYTSAHRQYIQAEGTGVEVHALDLPRAFSPEAKEKNRKTWQIFRETLHQILGKRKFDWICDRYLPWFDFSQEEHSGAPLLSKHVEIFSIGAAQVLKQDVKENNLTKKIKTYTRIQLHEKSAQCRFFPILGEYKDPVNILGTPGHWKGFFFHNKLLMDKEKQLLFSDTEQLAFHAWLERLAKVICNRELLEGQLIPAPGADGKIDYYKVYRKITSGDGLIAYGLKPATNDSTLKPLLCFRPSQWALANEDAEKTYLNDMQRKIGSMGWKGSRGVIDELMHDPHFKKENEYMTVAGYSLGGLHAQYFLAAYPDHVNHAVFYNDPSVPSKIAERFAARMNTSPRRREPLNIQIYRMEGDVCAYVGDKHIGWGVDHLDVNTQLILNDSETIKAYGLHSHRIFDNSTFPYNMQCIESREKLFNLLDNSKRGINVLWYEKTRRFWGPILFYLVKVLSVVLRAFSNLLGIKILRSSVAN